MEYFRTEKRTDLSFFDFQKLSRKNIGFKIGDFTTEKIERNRL